MIKNTQEEERQPLDNPFVITEGGDVPTERGQAATDAIPQHVEQEEYVDVKQDEGFVDYFGINEVSKTVPTSLSESSRLAKAASVLSGEAIQELTDKYSNMSSSEAKLDLLDKYYSESHNEAIQTFNTAVVEGDSGTATSAITHVKAPDEVTADEVQAATLAGTEATLEDINKGVKQLSRMSIGDTYLKMTEEAVEVSDTITSLATSIVPFVGSQSKALHDSLERLGYDTPKLLSTFFSNKDPIDAWREDYVFASDSGKKEMLEKLLPIIEDESAYFGVNTATVHSVLKTLLRSTDEDRNIYNGFIFADLGISLGAAVKGLVVAGIAGRTVSNITLSETLKNKEVTKDLLKESILSDSKDLTGATKEEAVDGLSILGGNRLVTDKISIADDVQKDLVEFASSEDMNKLTDMLPPSGITPSDIDYLVEKKAKDLKDVDTKDVAYVKVLNSDDNGATFEVLLKTNHKDARGDDNGWSSEIGAKSYMEWNNLEGKVIEHSDGKFYIQTKRKVGWEFDDLQGHNIGVSNLSWIPGTWRLSFPFQSGDTAGVGTRLFGVRMEESMKNASDRLWNESMSGLSSDGKGRVLDAIKRGDDWTAERGRVLTTTDLEVLGLEGKEINSYYKVLQLREGLYYVKDQAVVRELNMNGMSKITIPKASGSFKEDLILAGKKIEAKSFKGDSPLLGQAVYDIQSDAVIVLDKRLLGDDSFDLIKMYTPTHLKGADYSYVRVHNKQYSTDVITTAVQRRSGEIQRVYTDPYFIYTSSKKNMNGVNLGSTRNRLTAPMKKDAVEYKTRANMAMDAIEEGIKKGALTRAQMLVLAEKSMGMYDYKSIVDDIVDGTLHESDRFSFKFDGDDVTAKGGIDAFVKSNNSIFTSSRGKRLKSINGDYAPIADPLDSISKEINSTANFASINLWRQASLEKLYKTFEGRWADEGYGSKFELAMKGEVPNITATEQNFLDGQRHNINAQMGFTGIMGGKASQVFFRDIAVMLEGVPVGGEWAAKQAYKNRRADPVQRLKALTFHRFLGMFNPEQFLVQSAGMMQAIAVHPEHGLQAAGIAPFLRMAVYSDSLKDGAMIKELSKRMGKMSKDLGVDTKTLDMYVKLVKQTKILSDIESSALTRVRDYSVLDGGAASRVTDKVSNGLDKVLTAGMIPFKAGEEFARLTSLVIAHKAWKKSKPIGTDPFSRTSLQELVTLQEKYTLGMSRANLGWLQTGLTAVPFQMAQFNWKIISTALGKNLTGAERAKLLGFTTLFVGLEGMGAHELGKKIWGDEISEEDSTARLFGEQGLLTAMMHASGVAENKALGSRVGWGTYWRDIFIDVFGNQDPQPILKTFGGAAWSTVEQGADHFNKISNILINEKDLTLNDTILALDEVAKFISPAYNKAQKRYIALKTDGYLKDKFNSSTYSIDMSNAVWSTLGVKDRREVQVSNYFLDDKARRNIKKAHIKTAGELLANITSSSSPDERELRENALNAFMYKVVPENMYEEVSKGAYTKHNLSPLFSQIQYNSYFKKGNE